jgi:hypothetical protein
MNLADLDARSASEAAFEFEYLLPSGAATGVFLSVLGSQSPKVSSEINRLVNERRRQQAVADAQPQLRGAEPTFTPVESDQEFNQRLAAVRLAGWRGLDDEFTPENALRLCQTNQDISDQIIQRSNNVANFLKLAPKS